MAILAWVVGGVVLAIGTLLFAPWTLWTRSRLDEAPPGGVHAASRSVGKLAESAVTELGSGRFRRQEHNVTGTARLLQLPGGSRVLRLEDFATSDGPDLHVWLCEKSAGGNWFKYNRGRRVRLGALKATDGNHNYPIPPGADLAGLRSAVIWCRRFHVAFGSAPLMSVDTRR